MSKRPGKNKANLEETRQIFLDISREEFAESGYAEASTSRIVQKSGMARGSLYYHFGDKNGLFQAVYKDLMYNGLEKISAKMDVQTNEWDALMTGIHAFLDLCMDKTYRKIVLIESQAAMNFHDRFKIHEQTLLGKMRTLLPPLLGKGHFPGHTENTLAIFIFGIVAEIGRSFDSSPDIPHARKTFGNALDQTMSLMKSK